jgi:DNA-binding response OmpR family regulator
MFGKSVLLVDDDPEFTGILEEFLTLKGMKVTVADNGSRAYESQKRKRGRHKHRSTVLSTH